ncbi:MAG TPA: hypothetical protein VGF01_20110 [Terracidiphilus sp.]|jgi:hypothetical protein
MMRLSVRTSAALAALAFLALPAVPRALAQSTAAPTAGNGTYIAIDPLARVRYDNRYDLSLGAAYGHIHAGPNALQGANLGGIDLSASYWFSKHWAAEGTGRGYLGTSGVASVGGSNSGLNSVRGPFVSQYLFAAGPEWLGPHNKHGDIILHALGGGAYFLSHDWPQTPAGAGFYDNQVAPAAVFGGHIDLNRSEHWVFRVTPDALFTRYGYSFNAGQGSSSPHTNWNAAIAVGIEYKFRKKR